MTKQKRTDKIEHKLKDSKKLQNKEHKGQSGSLAGFGTKGSIVLAFGMKGKAFGEAPGYMTVSSSKSDTAKSCYGRTLD